MYGWTSVVVLSLFVVIVFGGILIKYSLSWLKGMYQVLGQPVATFLRHFGIISLILHVYTHAFSLPAKTKRLISVMYRKSPFTCPS